jgi:predicted RNase H-like HicB family nuclease
MEKKIFIRIKIDISKGKNLKGEKGFWAKTPGERACHFAKTREEAETGLEERIEKYFINLPF